MTIAQIIECILGKVSAIEGHDADGTPFNDVNIEEIKDRLEKLGYHRNGIEYMYNGMTGQKLKIMIFIGPTYYHRLKHLVEDKIHCLSMDTEILTLNGWKFYKELTKNDKIATLKDNKLVYENPIELLYYPDYKGSMYYVSNSEIDLAVTGNHRMWVSIDDDHYNFQRADEIIGKSVRYKKDAEWNMNDYPFQINSHLDISQCDGLPEWVFKLGQNQAQQFIRSIITENNLITKYKKMADDLQQLCLHAGWSATISDNYVVSIKSQEINKTINPESNNEKLIYEKCPVFCLQVPSEVFYVRRNGKGCWTGNSRARGPRTILTRRKLASVD